MFLKSLVLLSLLVACQQENQTTRPNSGAFIINEFVAKNKASLLDEDGQAGDWIELKNIGDSPASLLGWFLSDDETNLRKWAFPDIRVAPGAFVVVFADGQNKGHADGSVLHTNFKLNADGEFLALSNGGDVMSRFAPKFAAQYEDISWGTHIEPGYHFLSPPTPGRANASSAVVNMSNSPIEFSKPGGLLFAPANVTVGSELPGILRFTRDGTMPTSESELVDGPITVNGSVELRVALFSSESSSLAEAVRSEVYLLVEDSLRGFNSNLPVMIVDTYEDARIDDVERPRVHRRVGAVAFGLQEATARAALMDDAHFVGRGGMHIRGNSTAGYEKKQYAFETWDENDADKDITLLGLPGESDWVLHAPFSDKTLIRNYLMYRWSNAIGRYASRTAFIELFINRNDRIIDDEDYVGVYVFMEKVKQGKNRVNISNLNPDDNSDETISGGYLLEKGWGFSEAIGIRTPIYEDELQFISPKAVDITSAQRRYLETYFENFEQALSSSSFTDIYGPTCWLREIY